MALSAVPDELTPAETAARDFDLQYAPVVKMAGLTSEYSYLLFAVPAHAWQLEYPADAVNFADQVLLALAAHAALNLTAVAVFGIEFPNHLAVECKVLIS